MDADPIPHDALLRHAGFLRGLARDLVRDPATAEDAVQDVWLLALEHPPKHASNLRGWLRVLLTNLVRSKARSTSRREMRERERAIDHREHDLAAPPDDELMLRPVTEAVLALPEPLRSTVLRHYFQGMTTSAIALKEGIPHSTVKSRLQRALEVLRVRLKDQRGDMWAVALLPLTSHGAHHIAAGAGIGKGVLLMSLKTKIAVACGLALIVGVLCREMSQRAASPEPVAPSPITLADVEAAHVTTLAGSDGLTQQPAPAGREIAISEEIPAKVAERPESSFHGSLLNPDGTVVRDAWAAHVSVTDAAGRRRNCDAKDEGTFAFSSLPKGKYWVSAYAYGYRMLEDGIELESDHAQVRRDFTLTPMPMLKIRVTTPDGENLLDILEGPRAPNGRPVLVPVATKERPGAWFTEVVGSLNNPFGIGHFWQYGPRAEPLPRGCMGILLIEGELPAFVSLLNYHRVLQTQEVQLGQDEVRFVLSLDQLQASYATIRMQVIDADTQAPIVGARAALGDDSGTRTQSDAEGQIVVKDHAPGEFDLVVSAEGHESYAQHFLADSGTVTDLGRIALGRSLQVSVNVVDGNGTPRAERFELARIDAVTDQLVINSNQGYQSTADGKLNLGALGRRAYVIRGGNLDAVNDSEAAGIQWVSGNVVLDLRSGNAPVPFVVKLVPGVRVTVSVIGRSADGMRFVVKEDQGMELLSRRFYGNGPRPLNLPPGKYRITLLDADGTVLEEKSVSLGETPLRVDFER